MARYIDADKLKELVNGRSSHWLNEWDTLGVLGVIDEAPTADVQEVVKCKDCVYATYMLLHRDDKPVIWRCERMQCRLSDENSYCSWARRKAQPIRKGDDK